MPLKNKSSKCYGQFVCSICSLFIRRTLILIFSLLFAYILRSSNNALFTKSRTSTVCDFENQNRNQKIKNEIWKPEPKKNFLKVPAAGAAELHTFVAFAQLSTTLKPAHERRKLHASTHRTFMITIAIIVIIILLL